MRSFALLVLAVSAQTPAPRQQNVKLDGVMKLLKDMANKNRARGVEAAAAYDKQACACRDVQKEKEELLKQLNTDLTTDLTTLGKSRTDYGTANTDKEAEEGKLTKSQGELDGHQADKKQLDTDCKKANAVHEALIAQLGGAIDFLRKAEATGLKEAKGTTTFLQMQAKIQALLAQSPAEVPTSNYDFHSGDIVKLLKSIREDQRKELVGKKTECNKQMKAVDTLIIGKKDDIRTHNDIIDKKTALMQDNMQTIGEMQESTTDKQALHRVTAAELKESWKACKKLKEEWDVARDEMTEEMNVLGYVMHIFQGIIDNQESALAKQDQEKRRIMDATSDTATTAERAAAQRKKDNIAKGDLLKLAQTGAEADKPVAEVNGDEVEMIDGPDAASSFLQVRSLARSPTDHALDVLETASKRFPELKTVVGAIQTQNTEGGPFDQVIVLIRGMIAKLRKDLDNKMDSHEECVRHKKDTMQKWTDAKEAAEEAEVSYLEKANKHDQLDAQVKDLKRVSQDNKDAKADYEQHKKDTVKNFGAIQKSLEEVTDEIAKAKTVVEKLAADKDLDMSNVLGLIDVITTDYEQEKKDNAKEEKETLAFYTETIAGLDKELAKQKATEDAVEAERASVEKERNAQSAAFKTAAKSMATEQRTLVTGPNSITGRKCVGGMSYEDRVAARDAEIKALEEAYGILKTD
jgi:hypothetical protein